MIVSNSLVIMWCIKCGVFPILIPNEKIVRPHTNRKWKEDGKSNTARDSFTRSAAKLWNQAPASIKEANSLTLAKKHIKVYCENLPIWSQSSKKNLLSTMVKLMQDNSIDFIKNDLIYLI